MRTTTYRAKFIKNGKDGDYLRVCKIMFDVNGKMQSLKIYDGNDNVVSVDPADYEIVGIHEDITDKEVEEIVDENKARKEKFRIGKR